MRHDAGFRSAQQPTTYRRNKGRGRLTDQGKSLFVSEPGKRSRPAGKSATAEPLESLLRLFMDKMGSVPLLTREGEVEIYKRIEAGVDETLSIKQRGDEPSVPSGPAVLSIRHGWLADEIDTAQDRPKTPPACKLLRSMALARALGRG